MVVQRGFHYPIGVIDGESGVDLGEAAPSECIRGQWLHHLYSVQWFGPGNGVWGSGLGSGLGVGEGTLELS